MTKAPTVVLDTNVVLSALLFPRGRLTPIRDAWLTGRCRPVVSRATAEELLRALSYPKFRLSAADREELMGEYLPYCRVVRIPSRPPAAPQCRDPFDAAFLHLAIVAKADYLVTGDHDLTSLAKQVPFTIVTAAAFMATIAR